MKVYKTRFEGLTYTKLAPGLWRFMWGDEDNKPAVVGPMYHSKMELLCDVDRYAKEWGL